MTQATKRQVAPSTPQRLNININEETADTLRKLKVEKGMSTTELVRNAIALYDYLVEEKKAGRKIQTSNSLGKEKHEIVFL